MNDNAPLMNIGMFDWSIKNVFSNFRLNYKYLQHILYVALNAVNQDIDKFVDNFDCLLQ